MVRPPIRKLGSLSQRVARPTNTDGCEKKNGSIQRNWDATSQIPIRSTRTAACNRRTDTRRLAGIGCHHFLFKIQPECFVDLCETRDKSSLRNATRTRQVYKVVGLDSCIRSGRK